jgi:hypothetical protein
MRRRVTLVAALAALALGLAWWLCGSRLGTGSAASAHPAGSPRPNTAESGAAPASPYAGEEPSHLADRLNAPDADIASDLRVLNDVFTSYRSATHGGNPVGQNVDITAALTGRNSLGFAFIPPNQAAINSRGELCDRWGTPFFFHQESGTRMEIRSAGPDRKMWTDDDAVFTPPGTSQPEL